MSESYASNPALALALRRGRLSDQLLADSLKPRNVGGHAGGLAQMGTALIGGVMAGLENRRIDRLMREDRETADAQIAALYGRGPAPVAPGGPAPVTPGSLPPPIPNPEMTGQPAPAGGTAMPVAAPAQPPAQMPEPPAPRMVRLANGQEINLDVLQRLEASPNQSVRLAAAGARRSIDDDRAERRFQEQLALQRASAARATAAAGRESFGQPTEMTDANGQRVMVQVGNRGTIRPVQGYSAPPAAPAREVAASFTPANAAAMLADMAAAYEAGTLTPEQANRYEIAASMMQRPQTYLDQQTGQMVTVPAMTFPEPIQRALAAGQARRAGAGGATVPAAAPGLPMPDMAAPAPMVQGPRAGMMPPVMPQEMPAPAAPIAPPAAPGVMPRAGDATAMPPMVGEQSRIALPGGGNVTTTQVRPERGPAPPANFRWAENGILEPIPGGPADPRTQSLTEAEAKANLFGTQMKMSQDIIGNVRAPSGVAIAAWRNAPSLVVNPLLNENDQQYFNAVRLFAAGILRKETGAAFTPGEMLDVHERFFPQPGDSAAVIQQKDRARQAAISSIEAEVRGGMRGGNAASGNAPPGSAAPAARPTARMRWNPQTNQLEPAQ
jgi:hypothetical protein